MAKTTRTNEQASHGLSATFAPSRMWPVSVKPASAGTPLALWVPVTYIANPCRPLVDPTEEPDIVARPPRAEFWIKILVCGPAVLQCQLADLSRTGTGNVNVRNLRQCIRR